MNWIAPSAKDPLTDTLEQRLWASADQFRANSGLKAQEYSSPILGIIFLRFAEGRFGIQRARLETAASSYRQGSRIDEPAAYKHWQEIFNNDATLTAALLDRLLHHVETIVIEGRSYRTKEQINPP
jgi:type I restriction enzyme M protein